MAKRALTDMQRLFVAEYLVDFSARAAAIRAGYSPDNSATGAELMQNPRVRDEIVKHLRRVEAKLELTGDDIRAFHARVMCDPRQPSEGGPTWNDRILAAKELGKLLGLYTTKLQLTGSLSLVDLLTQAEAARTKQETPALPPATTIN